MDDELDRLGPPLPDPTDPASRRCPRCGSPLEPDRTEAPDGQGTRSGGYACLSCRIVFEPLSGLWFDWD